MTEDVVLTLGRETIMTVLLVALPVLGAGLLVGVSISIFQAATSIQDFTMTFIPKILAVMLMFFLLFSWILEVLIEFTKGILGEIPKYIG